MLLRGLIKLHRNSMKQLEQSKNHYKQLLEEKIQEACSIQQDLHTANEQLVEFKS
jgi:hypothetical protein